MALPDRVFVIVVETDGERDPDRMDLLTRAAGNTRITPGFSSMLLATTFLARAQELGYYVKLDYIFPAEGRQLTDDFPDRQFVLDISPEAFFSADSKP